MSALFWTEDRPDSGWHILKDGLTFRAEEIKGPRALTAPSLAGLVQLLVGEDTALERRYSEEQFREAVAAAGGDLEEALKALRATS